MIERLLRHERGLVLAGVVAVAALAWFDLWRRARGIMDMAMPEMEPWSLAEFGAIAAPLPVRGAGGGGVLWSVQVRLA